MLNLQLFVSTNFNSFIIDSYWFREPELKRTICKKCGLILKPGLTAKLNITAEQNEKTKVCSIECTKCGFTKRYVLNKNYSLWLDNDASVKEILEPDDLHYLDQNKDTTGKEKPSTDTKNVEWMRFCVCSVFAISAVIYSLSSECVWAHYENTLNCLVFNESSMNQHIFTRIANQCSWRMFVA